MFDINLPASVSPKTNKQTKRNLYQKVNMHSYSLLKQLGVYQGF